MKSFIASILLFSAISVAVVLLGVRDTNTTEDLMKQSEDLFLSLKGETETPSEDHLTTLRAFWDEKSPHLSYTVSVDHLNEIENALARVEGAFVSGDNALRIIEARALYDAAKSLYERVKPSFRSVI